MPMGNVWSFPSRKLTYDQTLGAMRALAGRIQKLTAGHKEYGHPVDLNVALEPLYIQAAAQVTNELELAEPGVGEVLVRYGASGLCHSDLSVINGVAMPTAPTMAAPVTTLAFNASYNISDRLVVTFDATNLTNVKRAYYRYSEEEPQKLDVSGRQYYLNLRYKF